MSHHDLFRSDQIEFELLNSNNLVLMKLFLGWFPLSWFRISDKKTNLVNSWMTWLHWLGISIAHFLISMNFITWTRSSYSKRWHLFHWLNWNFLLIYQVAHIFFIHVNQWPCQRWVQFKLNNFFTAKLNVSFFNGSTLHLEFMGKKWRFKHHGNTQLLFSPPNYGNHLLSNTAKKLDAPCQCPKTQFSRQ